MQENQFRVISMVQNLLGDIQDKSLITPGRIAEEIERVLRMRPDWGVELDRDAVTDELIRRFSLWIGHGLQLVSNEGHEAWLTSARKRGWRYWRRYSEYIEPKLAPVALERLDESTDKILGFLEDPLRAGPWDRRGLVVGHVQSGKTSNYTGLICKAADAGYKLVVVLAGLHNNLRAQTQMRLDEGFLGYETRRQHEASNVIGVGLIDADPRIRPNFATNRSEGGDFSSAVAKNLGVSPEKNPWLFVVKKNKTVLERLYGWIQNHVANSVDPESGRKVVTHLPLLLIDDEADNASIDTGEVELDSDGSPSREHQPKPINSLIRKILHSFSCSAYVGYTATPFANIFIHEGNSTNEEGPDLFPSAFIHCLPTPDNYIGPSSMFTESGIEVQRAGLDLVKRVEDFRRNLGESEWIPVGHKNGFLPRYEGTDVLPPSLTQAIDSFLIACAVRGHRGQGGAHCSMLIHVTRFNSVQQEIHRQVEQHIRQLRQRITRRYIDSQGVLERLRDLYYSDFETITESVKSTDKDYSYELPSWEALLPSIENAVGDIQVRMINGKAKDALDYKENENTGLKVIAIGGDKLARGLTLEGLTTSYFLRASRMYDTLMQMGRWFGYRPGYLDLCRLYTSNELVDWFTHITEAGEELREEFDLMAESGATPKDYGLKVRSHGVLMVTSPIKMRTARSVWLSFSGQVSQTVTFFRDQRKLKANLEALRQLLRGLPSPYVSPSQERPGREADVWRNVHLWREVSALKVIEFLDSYQTHPNAIKTNSALLAEFVAAMAEDGELTEWTIAILSGEGEPYEYVNGVTLNMIQREARSLDTDRFSIGTLISPRDEAIDLDGQAWKAALDLTVRAWQKSEDKRKKAVAPEIPSGPAIRQIRGQGDEGVPAHPERGLMLVYPIDPGYAKAGLAPDGPPVVAIVVSFPGSQSTRRVEYKINNVGWEEYGPD